MIEKFALIHNVSVHILCDSSNILELLLDELSGFTICEKTDFTEQVLISIAACETLEPRPNISKVYEDKGGVTKYYDVIQNTSHTYYYNHVSICVWQDTSSIYHIKCRYRSTFTNYLDITSELIYELVYRVLTNFGFYPLHSGCIINRSGHCVVICGNSFRGKTTLCLSALEHGYKILSDDMPILKRKDGHVQAFSFPRTLRVCDDTMEHFPRLKKHIAYTDREFLYLKKDIAILPETIPENIAKKMRRGIKARILLDEVYNKPIIPRAMPICLVLLALGKTYSAQKITPQKAFNTILMDNLPIYSFRGSRKGTYEKFSHVIHQLISQCELYEITLGNDLVKNCVEFVKMVDAL